MNRIGIVVAVEIGSFIKKYSDKLIEENVNRFKVYSFELNNMTIYITQSGAGEIRAAACTQMMISRFNVQLIINYGVAGALRNDLAVSDTCVVEKVVHYDMDTSSADNCEIGRYLEYDDIYLRTTSSYVKMVRELDDDIIPVICASGDKFIADENRKRELSKQFNADICDMESAAIVLVCDQNAIPNLLIKTISDSILGGVSEFRISIEKASDICLSMIERIISCGLI